MLRDKFAMAALQGIMSETAYWRIQTQVAAKTAYDYADAMMKERAKQDFSGDPDCIDLGAILSEQNNAPIVPMPNESNYQNAIKDALKAAVTRKHGIEHYGNETIPQLIHQLETGLIF